MSIGIRLHDSAQGALRERAAAVRAQGFACVHLALGKTLAPEYMEPRTLTAGLADHVRREMGGLDVAVLGCYLQLATPDEKRWQANLEKYIAHLRMARWLGAGVVGTETDRSNLENRYDPAETHSEDALKLLIDRLCPVVEAAEKLGSVLAIEPVYTHIVSTSQRARRVLDAIHSPNLQIIFDPVNLLHRDNLDRRDAVMAEAMELLGDEIAVLHMKDYDAIAPDGGLHACAAGSGLMRYDEIFRFAREKKPFIHMTLEDTRPENAERARAFCEKGIEG